MQLPPPYRVSTDPALLDVPLIHEFLSQQSYWARNVPLGVLRRALDNSLCFGLYAPEGQVGFARVITDRATFGYLADVFVLAAHRGRGLGHGLLGAVMAHPDLQGLRRFMLVTRDAHGLYEEFGFSSPTHPQRLMEKLDPDVYLRHAAPPA